MSRILLNYAYLWFWSILGEIHRELFFLDIKVTTSKTRTEILRKFVFLTIFEKGLILRKIWICLSNIFYQTSKRGKILTKTVFLPKLSHTLLNYDFLFVLKHLWRNSQKNSLFLKKMISQLRALKYSESLFFLPYLKGENPKENLDLFKQLFFNQTSKRG